MKSLVGTIVDAVRRTPAVQAPVSYATQGRVGSMLSRNSSSAALMQRTSTNGTLFSIVDLLATSTASATWHLYRKPKPGTSRTERTEVFQHVALNLWNQPNAFFGQDLFVQTFQQHKDLAGEFWWIVVRNSLGWPESLWCVRPDRMTPIPSATHGLAGYVYTGPDGEHVPFQLGEVIWNRTPNPLDPGPAGRGLSAVQSILADLDAASYSAEWNRNFFINGAEPGGIIQAPDMLSDEDFNRITMRWNEQHRGVSNAHRVALLEGGLQWKDRAFSQRDMQFAELRGVSRDVVREAFRIHSHMLGQTEDVNLANAQAADYTFARWQSVPRLETIKGILNTVLLPMFGVTGHGTGMPDVEFDYDSPVPEDKEAEDRRRGSIASAASFLTAAGYDGGDVANYLGLPPMQWAPRPAASPHAAIDGGTAQ